MVDVRDQAWLRREPGRSVDQCGRSRVVACAGGAVGSGRKTTCTLLVVDCELGCPLERRAGGRVTTSVLCALRRPLELVGHLVTRSRHRRRAVPSAPVRVLLALEGIGECLVCGAARAKRRSVVDGGTHQRMPELETGLAGAEQAGRLGGIERLRCGAERLPGT